MIDQSKDALVKAILAADRDKANQILEFWAEKEGLDQAIHDVLEPCLQTIGDLWETTHEVSLAQGYVAGKIAEDFMLKAARSDPKYTTHSPTKGTVVLGNIEDDYHSLGRKLVGIFLQCNGWQVHDLGNDVPAEAFLAKALEVKATIIGVSAMMYSTAKNIRKVRTLIDNSNVSGTIKLAVGGAVFKIRPELVEEVGGNGTAANALQVSALFEALNQKAGRP